MSLAAILPEARRNIRIQLRPKRLLAIVVISVVASLATYVSSRNPADVLDVLLGGGIAVLMIGGGIYCLQAIHREKELNTFDYQRITRLRPLEIALGKLFGAPSLAYFVALCLAPFTIFAAFLSHLSLSTILWVYVVFLLGSIVWHALALLISMLAGRGTSAGMIILFLVIVLFGSGIEGNRASMLGLHNLSPFFALELVRGSQPLSGSALPPNHDFLFGMLVPHVWVLVVLFPSLTAWFLLGLARNIKRDPAVYEIYSPPQAFGFVLYLNLILLAFFQWTRVNPVTDRSLPDQVRFEGYRVMPMQAENEFLAVSLWFFAIFGLALLRNRERVRRRVLALGHSAANWWAALWPAPYVLGGILVTGLALIAMVWHELHPEGPWCFGVAFFQVGFLAVWLARDILYLQWMNLRRAGRPLVSALIYLVVFYASSGAVYTGVRSNLGRARASAAYLEPWTMFDSNPSVWIGAVNIWIGALVLLALEAVLFAFLQQRQLKKLYDSANA